MTSRRTARGAFWWFHDVTHFGKGCLLVEWLAADTCSDPDRWHPRQRLKRPMGAVRSPPAGSEDGDGGDDDGGGDGGGDGGDDGGGGDGYRDEEGEEGSYCWRRWGVSLGFHGLN